VDYSQAVKRFVDLSASSKKSALKFASIPSLTHRNTVCRFFTDTVLMKKSYEIVSIWTSSWVAISCFDLCSLPLQVLVLCV